MFLEKGKIMLRVSAIFLLLSYFSLHAMENLDTCNIAQWRKIKLETLSEHSKIPTHDPHSQEARALLKRFVHICLEKYELTRNRLSQLAVETGGVIRETSDSDIAAEDPKKFLRKQPLECTSEEIDKRWERIKCIENRS